MERMEYYLKGSLGNPFYSFLSLLPITNPNIKCELKFLHSSEVQPAYLRGRLRDTNKKNK